MSLNSYQVTHGTAQATNAAADAEVIAAPAAGKVLRILKGFVSVHTAAVGGGGLVKLEDGAGGTAIFTADADAVGVYPIDFGERGYPLTAATKLNLTVDSAVTTQATARATFISYIV
jgi:hypothetical protein